MNVEDIVFEKVRELRRAGFTRDEIYMKFYRALDKAMRERVFDESAEEHMSLATYARQSGLLPRKAKMNGCHESCPECGRSCNVGPRHKRHYCADEDGSLLHFWN